MVTFTFPIAANSPQMFVHNLRLKRDSLPVEADGFHITANTIQLIRDGLEMTRCSPQMIRYSLRIGRDKLRMIPYTFQIITDSPHLNACISCPFRFRTHHTRNTPPFNTGGFSMVGRAKRPAEPGAPQMRGRLRLARDGSSYPDALIQWRWGQGVGSAEDPVALDATRTHPSVTSLRIQ